MRKKHTDGTYTNATFFEDVGQFHRRCNLPVTEPGRPHEMLTPEILDYRVRFMKEELAEFIEAAESRDAAGMLDALVDLTWVCMGTAHYMGVPFVAAWDEVTKANMAKVALRDDQQHPTRPVERVHKPPDWVPPDIEGVLERHDKGQRS